MEQELDLATSYYNDFVYWIHLGLLYVINQSNESHFSNKAVI